MDRSLESHPPKRMNPGKQRTVAKEITLDGIGVHSGQEATLTFKPGDADSGIVFRRTDLEDAPEIPATLEHVTGTELGTSLGVADAQVLTVEHVMAALYCAGIDNAVIDVSGPEVPIRDGSFGDYVSALGDAGGEELDAERTVIAVAAPLSLNGSADESYVATPSDGLRVSATIDFEHPAIGRQYGSFTVNGDTFGQELAAARTFGFKSDAELLRSRGLALGASLDNTIVLDESGVMNDGLRFPDEFLRHKVGDIVGDLALLGARVDAHIVAERPSHQGNVALARKLAEQARRAGRAAYVDAAKIMQYLPHRYPMLLVDRIIDFEEGKRIVGIKNVTINEPFFQGHYPGHPIMPGVLIIEAMAQVGGLLLMDAVHDPESRVVYFMTMDNVKWRRPVTPGDTIVFEVEILQIRTHTCKMRGKGFVDGSVVAEADFMARIVDR
jgi:UDP-3-O-[3-hydroxymyristoyl] N-acetylglucosamine deacetylase/3-hydroxyacyl-[acyl-carrier-protein] dehydratase